MSRSNARFKRIVVLTGAGISAESGISTFRDKDGIWSKVDFREVATPEGFARNPQRVLERGYSIVQRADGSIVTAPEHAPPGAPLTVRAAGGSYGVQRTADAP